MISYSYLGREGARGYLRPVIGNTQASKSATVASLISNVTKDFIRALKDLNEVLEGKYSAA